MQRGGGQILGVGFFLPRGFFEWNSLTHVLLNRDLQFNTRAGQSMYDIECCNILPIWRPSGSLPKFWLKYALCLLAVLFWSQHLSSQKKWLDFNDLLYLFVQNKIQAYAEKIHQVREKKKYFDKRLREHLDKVEAAKVEQETMEEKLEVSKIFILIVSQYLRVVCICMLLYWWESVIPISSDINSEHFVLPIGKFLPILI